jgi:hypothetical protein
LWTFVLRNLKEYLATTKLFQNGVGSASVGMNKVIFVSDMGSAVQAAVAEVFPDSPHLLCIEHRKVRGRMYCGYDAGLVSHGVHVCVSLCSETSRIS